ncbi:MAG: 16S rRNA (adenine(1518)-N(6)/adenine(1519)-N(6))-dimethyltransferase, partial [Cryomorphaceae bacterium]|nr:16S rRNA (adenine(1518)-N(6)/adenine(1519)-N(6))-dimethyltransferase [Cryomorphaceae bacterium]
MGMFQKEVAERVAEKPGSKTYGILSVLLQAFYDINYCFTVDEHVFNPPPKVKSGVIRCVRNERKQLPCDEKLFFQVVKMTFNQRRKTIRNSVKGLLKGAVLEHPLLSERPEKLSVEQFIELTFAVQSVTQQSGESAEK